MRYVFAGGVVNIMALLAALVLAAGVEAAEPARILALGDSLTTGYGLNRSDSFTLRLEAALRRDGVLTKVINGGVSGDTTAGGLARLDWALSESGAEPGIKLVIIELGANDGLRGLDPKLTAANLDQIIVRIKKTGIPVLLTGMKAPPNLGARYAADFDSIFPRLAARHGVAFYPFFLDGVAAMPALNQKDGIHPNAKGVEIIVKRMLPVVKEVLKGGGG